MRGEFESAMGADLGSVRIHADSELAPEIGAQAFTLGNDVHFAPGTYDPGSASGQHLIAHELTHVVQQTGAAMRAPEPAALVPIAPAPMGDHAIQPKGDKPTTDSPKPRIPPCHPGALATTNGRTRPASTCAGSDWIRRGSRSENQSTLTLAPGGRSATCQAIPR